MLLPLLASGCISEELYTQLEEREANEMVAILQFNGIEANKVNKGKGAFAIEISNGTLARAVDLLHGWGYPRSNATSLGELFKPEGIVPTQMEEQIRFLYGVGQELNQTLGYLNGVIDSRVHIALSNIEGNPIARQKVEERNSASVFILYDDRQEVLGTLIPKIKQLVGNSLPNLTVDNVVVLAQPAINFEYGSAGNDMDKKVNFGNLLFRSSDLAYIGGAFGGLLLLNIGLLALFLFVLLRAPKQS